MKFDVVEDRGIRMGLRLGTLVSRKTKRSSKKKTQMSVVRPQSFPSHIHAGFTGARKPPDFHGERFTFDLQGDAEGDDSVASRLWLLGYCGVGLEAWRDVEQVHGDHCIVTALQ